MNIEINILPFPLSYEHESSWLIEKGKVLKMREKYSDSDLRRGERSLTNTKLEMNIKLNCNETLT